MSNETKHNFCTFYTCSFNILPQALVASSTGHNLGRMPLATCRSDKNLWPREDATFLWKSASSTVLPLFSSPIIINVVNIRISNTIAASYDPSGFSMSCCHSHYTEQLHSSIVALSTAWWHVIEKNKHTCKIHLSASDSFFEGFPYHSLPIPCKIFGYHQHLRNCLDAQATSSVLNLDTWWSQTCRDPGIATCQPFFINLYHSLWFFIIPLYQSAVFMIHHASQVCLTTAFFQPGHICPGMKAGALAIQPFQPFSATWKLNR